MYGVLTVQIQIEHEDELNDRIEELEKMGYNVTVEYTSEEEDDPPIIEDEEILPIIEDELLLSLEDIEFDEEDE